MLVRIQLFTQILTNNLYELNKTEILSTFNANDLLERELIIVNRIDKESYNYNQYILFNLNANYNEYNHDLWYENF